MKKYILTWGWEPPQYELLSKGRFRLFYHTEKYINTITYTHPETQEGITEDIPRWKCYVVEIYDQNLRKTLEQEPDSLECQKQLLTKCINLYDKSDQINSFTINGIPVWLDKDTRTGLMLRFEAEAAIGKTETTLWYEGQQFTLPLDKAIEMLKAIEVYASKCYNVTQEHLYNINSLEDIKNYDYKSGYPDKLNFELL